MIVKGYVGLFRTRLNESESRQLSLSISWYAMFGRKQIKERVKCKEVRGRSQGRRTYKASDSYDQCWNVGAEAGRRTGVRERWRIRDATRSAGLRVLRSGTREKSLW